MNWYFNKPEWLRWILFFPIMLVVSIIAIFFTEVIFRMLFTGVLGGIIPKSFQLFLIYVAVEPIKGAFGLFAIYSFIPRWQSLTEKIVFFILLAIYALSPIAYLLNVLVYKSGVFDNKLNAVFIGYLVAIPVVLEIHSILRKEIKSKPNNSNNTVAN